MNGSKYQRGTLKGPIDNVLSRLEQVRRCGSGWSARCPGPSHKRGDKHSSLSISEGLENKVLLKCFSGCDLDDIVRAIDLEVRDLFDNTSRWIEPTTHDYTDKDGKLVFQMARFPNKKLRYRQPNGNGWIWNIVGIERLPYNLPAVIEAIKQEKTIYACEGEGDSDRLISIGLVATCNPCGALNWGKELSKWFKGARIVILPDNDDIGHNHARLVSDSLRGIAAKVWIVELPGLEYKQDVSDWLSAGRSKEQLLDVIGTIVDLNQAQKHIDDPKIPLKIREKSIPGLTGLGHRLSDLMSAPLVASSC